MGFPSPAAGFADSRISLDAKFISHPAATYFMRSADTHYREGIVKGALLVAGSSLSSCDGSLRICDIGGEFMVKRYRTHPKPHLEKLATVERRRYRQIITERLQLCLG